MMGYFLEVNCENKEKLYRDGPYTDFFSQGSQVGNILTPAGLLRTSGP
jgi:hypothetical protein